MPDLLYHAMLLFPLFLLTTAGGYRLGKCRRTSSNKPETSEEVDGVPTLDQFYRGQKVWWYRVSDGFANTATLLEVCADGVIIQNDPSTPEMPHPFALTPTFIKDLHNIRPCTDDAQSAA